MHSLSALEWHVNLDMSGLSQRKKYLFATVFPVTLHLIQLSRRKQTWHHICVRFYFLDSRSSIIDKYAFYFYSKAVFSLDLNRKSKKINVC